MRRATSCRGGGSSAARFGCGRFRSDTRFANAASIKQIQKRINLLAAALCVLLYLSAASIAHAQHKKQPPAAPIDLNAATAEELQALPTIGPAMAKTIVDFREKSGPFRRAEDLLAIKGITKERLEKIRPYVKINAPNPKKQPTSQ
jgi:competence ComEA-like helix-hairpin-helix protein